MWILCIYFSIFRSLVFWVGSQHTHNTHPVSGCLPSPHWASPATRRVGISSGLLLSSKALFSCCLVFTHYMAAQSCQQVPRTRGGNNMRGAARTCCRHQQEPGAVLERWCSVQWRSVWVYNEAWRKSPGWEQTVMCPNCSIYSLLLFSPGRILARVNKSSQVCISASSSVLFSPTFILYKSRAGCCIIMQNIS